MERGTWQVDFSTCSHPHPLRPAVWHPLCMCAVWQSLFFCTVFLVTLYVWFRFFSSLHVPWHRGTSGEGLPVSRGVACACLSGSVLVVWGRSTAMTLGGHRTSVCGGRAIGVGEDNGVMHGGGHFLSTEERERLTPLLFSCLVSFSLPPNPSPTASVADVARAASFYAPLKGAQGSCLGRMAARGYPRATQVAGRARAPPPRTQPKARLCAAGRASGPGRR